MRYFLYGCLIAVCFIAGSANAQNPTFLQRFQTTTKDTPLLQAYWQNYRSTDSTYNCNPRSRQNARAIGNDAFDSLIRPAFSNIFLGPNDVVKNSTAASFAQDDKAGTLNLN